MTHSKLAALMALTKTRTIAPPEGNAGTIHPQQRRHGGPLLTLFVARLNLQTKEEKLKEVFSRYGDIRRLRLVRDLVTGFSRATLHRIQR